MSWSSYLFSFRGRLNRAKYWLFVLISVFFVIIVIGLAVPYVLIEHASTNELNHPVTPLLIATLIVECAAILALLISSLAVTVKRLHDRNKSAWWLIVFVFIPAMLNVICDPKVNPDLDPLIVLPLALVALGLTIWGFVEIGCLRGTVGDNRYGPDPLSSQASL